MQLFEADAADGAPLAEGVVIFGNEYPQHRSQYIWHSSRSDRANGRRISSTRTLCSMGRPSVAYARWIGSARMAPRQSSRSCRHCLRPVATSPILSCWTNPARSSASGRRRCSNRAIWSSHSGSKLCTSSDRRSRRASVCSVGHGSRSSAPRRCARISKWYAPMAAYGSASRAGGIDASICRGPFIGCSSRRARSS